MTAAGTPQPFAPYTFFFSIDWVTCNKRTNTPLSGFLGLSESTDTDYLSTTVQVSDSAPQTSFYKIGDVKEGEQIVVPVINGPHQVTDPDQIITAQYNIVNSSKNSDEVENLLKRAGRKSLRPLSQRAQRLEPLLAALAGISTEGVFFPLFVGAVAQLGAFFPTRESPC